MSIYLCLSLSVSVRLTVAQVLRTMGDPLASSVELASFHSVSKVHTIPV
jgi:hypothetical protein